MMDSKEAYPQRKQNRLDGYDYSLAGAYFVTICVQDRACLFGRIENGEVHLSQFGKIVEAEWLRTGRMRPNVLLDQYVIMPNHLHGIVIIDYPWLGLRQPEDAKQRLDRIVAGFKAACVRRINEARGFRAASIWQKSFHDEIIRNERHLANVRKYIADNASMWESDLENPEQQRQR
jgi:putative transposase